MADGSAAVVLVTGPASAGVSSVASRLRARMPGCTVVDAADGSAVPDAVVFVVSAVAPITESDCALAVRAAAQTDDVIAVLAKIDDHRDWRGVLAADRELLGRHCARLQQVPWVGVAAAPRLGQPAVDELVALLEIRLADPDLGRRNRLRQKEFHDERVREKVGALRSRREELAGELRLARSQNAIAVRNRVQQARVMASQCVRTRCAAARTELGEQAATASRREIVDFQGRVRQRCDELAAEVDDEVTVHLRRAAADLGLPAPPIATVRVVSVADPPATSRRLETQLMTVLGAGFGLGVALVVVRLLAGLGPRPTVAALAAGAIAGLGITAWVVGVRRLLHERAVLDRWVHETIAAVRTGLEERVALRVLAAEAALSSAVVELRDARQQAVAERIAETDAELREAVSSRPRGAPRAGENEAIDSYRSVDHAVTDI